MIVEVLVSRPVSTNFIKNINTSPETDLWWWVDSIQVRSECPLPPIALSPLCLSSSVPSLPPFRQSGIPVSLAMPHQLVGVGLATPPRKKYPQPPTRLEAEVGGGALGAGEPLATAPIQICWGGPTVQTFRVPSHQRGLPTGMTVS